MPRRSRRTRADFHPPDFFAWVSVCALAIASLSIFDRGGNTDRAVWLIAVCAVVALVANLVRSFYTDLPSAKLSFSSKAWIAALCLLSAYAIICGLPVSLDTWAALPGREPYQPVLQHLASPVIAATSIPITLAPDAGLRSVVLLLSCTAMGVCATSLSEPLRFRLLLVLVTVALIQALIGVAQIAFPGSSVFTVDYVGHVRAAGTFVNKNHLATLFALLVPFAALQASISLSNTNLRYDLRRLFSMLWIVTTVTLVLACIATLSRSGIAAVVAVLIATITFETLRSARRGKKRRLALASGVAATGLLALLLATSDSLFAAIGDPAAGGSFNARVDMYRATLAGAVALFPLGSGIGSFAVAFPAFQPADLIGFVEHAHNDVLQIVFEAGLVGCGAIALVVIAAGSAFRNWFRSKWNPIHGAYLLGSLGFALHANLDFPARIPALAVIATILFSFACSYREPQTDASDDEQTSEPTSS